MSWLNVSGSVPILDLQEHQVNVAAPDYPQSFDFSLSFEYTALSIVPSSILLVLAPVRLWSLLSKDTCAHGPAVRRLKLVRFTTSLRLYICNFQLMKIPLQTVRYCRPWHHPSCSLGFVRTSITTAAQPLLHPRCRPVICVHTAHMCFVSSRTRQIHTSVYHPQYLPLGQCPLRHSSSAISMALLCRLESSPRLLDQLRDPDTCPIARSSGEKEFPDPRMPR